MHPRRAVQMETDKDSYSNQIALPAAKHGFRASVDNGPSFELTP
jgi:hypothetical protein